MCHFKLLVVMSHIGDAALLYRWPHASTICRSVVNSDSSLLAIGLKSGGVVLWNLVSCELLI